MAMRPNWYDDDESPRRSFRWPGAGGSWGAVKSIVAISFGVWLLQLLLGGSLTQALALRAWFAYPNLDGTAVEISFNWLFPIQFVTYAVAHSPADLFHILFNMWMLWIFGSELEGYLGRVRFLRLYLGGAIAGGLLFWLSRLFAQSPAYVVGASGAVFAVLVLYACLNPNRTMIFFPIFVPLRVVTLVTLLLALDVMRMFFGSSGTVAVEAHIGGAIFGFLWFRKGDVLERVLMRRRRQRAEKIAAEEGDDRREMDRILAKIQATGLASLDERERGFLTRRSEELRRNRGP